MTLKVLSRPLCFRLVTAAVALALSSCQVWAPQFMGGAPQEPPDAYLAANPSAHPMHVTTVLLHGGNDALVSVNQALMVGARTLFVDGGGHFDWVHPGTRSYSVLLFTLQSVLMQ